MMQEVKLVKHGSLSIREMAFCGMFTALIATGAFIQINIPVQPFPMHFTLQFFFVLLAGFILGPRLGTLSVCIYLAVGLVGVPVFAAGGGPAYLVRPTFGFLLGFVFACYVSGTVAKHLDRLSFKWYLFSAFWGLIVMYLSGMLYFYFISNFVIRMPVTWKLVFINCFLLTVGGDFILCIMAALLARRLKPLVRMFDE